MNIELYQAQPVPKIKSRFALLPLRFEAGLWRAAAAGLWVAGSIGAAVGALGVPTGLGTGADLSIAIALNAAALALVSMLFAWLFRVCRCPLPPLTIGSAVYSATLLTGILYSSDIDWPFALLISSLYLAVGAGIGWLAAVLFGRRRAWRFKLVSVMTAVLLLAGLGYTAVGNPWSGEAADSLRSGLDGSDDADEAMADSGESSSAEIPSLAADDPSLPGTYSYTTFTYGSGTNRQRAEFGSKADVQSASVDASPFIHADDWSWLRTLYWGFDQKQLPLNGTVWLPEGDGPFPVVLIVHGNHLMEDSSDEGYAYLGELLASRGFAVVSVDENFLNYSAWSDIPKQDQKLRAWMLLRHIGQLQQFAADSSTSFYGKLDFSQIALIGHSRGGQAVAMAADRDEWFGPDAPDLPAQNSYSIRAVVAIAPTDVLVDGRSAWLRDISYLTLQGASDADISSFDGEKQYRRVSYSPFSTAFKASLYIEGANHGQFNTTWGARDDAMPAGLFLNKPELSGEEQRQIAKAYVSAFLEDALHGQTAYETLFRDYRAGASFLPDTTYYNQFENSSFTAIARYEEPGDPHQPSPSVEAEASGMTRWTQEETKDREGGGEPNHGVALQWDKTGGSYTLKSDSAFPMPSSADGSGNLIFSMADLTWELKNDGSDQAPEVTVTAEDAEGQIADVRLDEIMPVQPAAQTDFTWLNGLAEALDNGKYEEPTEAAFQTYEVPLDRFKQANASLDEDQIVRITFAFEGGPGKAMFDDIGLGD